MSGPFYEIYCIRQYCVRVTSPPSKLVCSRRRSGVALPAQLQFRQDKTHRKKGDQPWLVGINDLGTSPTFIISKCIVFINNQNMLHVLLWFLRKICFWGPQSTELSLPFSFISRIIKLFDMIINLKCIFSSMMSFWIFTLFSYNVGVDTRSKISYILSFFLLATPTYFQRAPLVIANFYVQQAAGMLLNVTRKNTPSTRSIVHLTNVTRRWTTHWCYIFFHRPNMSLGFRFYSVFTKILVLLRIANTSSSFRVCSYKNQRVEFLIFSWDLRILNQFVRCIINTKTIRRI